MDTLIKTNLGKANRGKHKADYNKLQTKTTLVTGDNYQRDVYAKYFLPVPTLTGFQHS